MGCLMGAFWKTHKKQIKNPLLIKKTHNQDKGFIMARTIIPLTDKKIRNGKSKEYAVGTLQKYSLEEARKEREKLKKLVARGLDINKNKIREVIEGYADYLEEAQNGGKI